MNFHERKLDRIIKMLQNCLPTTEEDKRYHMNNNYRYSLQEVKEVCIWNVGSDCLNGLYQKELENE